MKRPVSKGAMFGVLNTFTAELWYVHAHLFVAFLKHHFTSLGGKTMINQPLGNGLYHLFYLFMVKLNEIWGWFMSLHMWPES